MFDEAQLIAIVAAILMADPKSSTDAKTGVTLARKILTESQNQLREALKPRK